MTYDSTAVVTVDPCKNFGEPSANGGPSVAAVVGMVYGGEGVDQVAEQYGLTRPLVLVACWYVATYGTRAQRRRWRDWATEWGYHLARGEYDPIPDPPTREDER